MSKGKDHLLVAIFPKGGGTVAGFIIKGLPCGGAIFLIECNNGSSFATYFDNDFIIDKKGRAGSAKVEVRSFELGECIDLPVDFSICKVEGGKNARNPKGENTVIRNGRGCTRAQAENTGKCCPFVRSGPKLFA